MIARAFVVTVLLMCGASAQEPPPHPPIDLFLQAAHVDDAPAKAAMDQLAASWRPSYGPILLDMIRLLPRPAPVMMTVTTTVTVPAGSAPPSGPPPVPPSVSGPPLTPPARARVRLIAFLERQTGKRLGDDVWAWRQWFWQQPYDPHPGYAAFKGALYGRLDAKFAEFFPPDVDVRIRLDEVDFGGVKPNGIPPLDHPKTVGPAEATYLGDDHIVFGVVSGGEARAYPKRILAWHELARDTIGGTHVTVVYCTLCGTVIPYVSTAAGLKWTFGTSGLLYRSNKLLFDEESKSLWSTIEGVPVIGPLVARGIQLDRLPVVTTTWGEWKAAHPRTTVLSLDTGHQRDYREGAAYKEYFGTDDLMFRVARTDGRLKNKAEVLAMVLRDDAGARHPVALAADFLRRRPVHQFSAAGRSVVVLTTPKGANRVYESGGRLFSAAGGGRLKDDRGVIWRQTEDGLLAVDDPHAPVLRRVPAHRSFWFAWYAQFPQTLLVR